MTKIGIKKVFLFSFIILACDWYPVSKVYSHSSINNIIDLANFIIRFSRMNVLVGARTTMGKRLSCIARVQGKSGSLAHIL